MAVSASDPNSPARPSRDWRALHDTATTLAVLNRVFAHYGKRDFALRLWDGTTVPADPGEETRFALVLNSPTVLRRLLLPPNELSLGEAYLDGDWELEGDILAAMRLSDVFEGLATGPGELLRLGRQLLALPKVVDGQGGGGRGLRSGRERVELKGSEHSRERDRQAVTYHYDVGNEFFQLFLGRRMVYSCGYFPTGQEDLDTAQEAKLEYICRKLRLMPGERLLDIGCGWGALITYAAERFGVRATGITLSRPQAEFANHRIAEAGMADRARAVVMDYRDVESHGPFDKIVSVGMVEHVGSKRLSEYFQVAWEALKPGGLFLNHGITSAARDWVSSNPLDRYVFQKGAFIRRYIFPDGELIPVGETLGFAERAGFEVRDVESLREHYALTLRHWVHNLEMHREEVLRQASERFYRMWSLYMAGCSHAFSTGRMSVHQSLLSRADDRGLSRLPWNRADLYT